MMQLEVVPCTRAEAKDFVRRHHRHHAAPVSAIFQLAIALERRTVGVAVVGRPMARLLCDGRTLEVVRCCVLPGIKNGCSMLYGACWRAARALGYRRLITYTLPDEGGASLRAAGMTLIGEAGGGSWSRPSRPRSDLHPTQTKLRWELVA